MDEGFSCTGLFCRSREARTRINASAATYTTDVVVAMLWLEPFSPKTTFGWDWRCSVASCVKIILLLAVLILVSLLPTSIWIITVRCCSKSNHTIDGWGSGAENFLPPSFEPESVKDVATKLAWLSFPVSSFIHCHKLGPGITLLAFCCLASLLHLEHTQHWW